MKTVDFDIFADFYDDYYQTETGKIIDFYEKQCVNNLLGELKFANTLEVGCGTGHWTEFFSEKSNYITGIDISEKMLQKAKNKRIKNAKFLTSDAENLPFENETFDAVFAVTVLEFVENQEKAISEIKRILKNNGYFLWAGLLKGSILWENRHKQRILSNADFFEYSKIEEILSAFGDYRIETCICDENPKIRQNCQKNIFFVALAQKLNIVNKNSSKKVF